MKIISIFNNKGGVGKTNLTFHLAHALAAMGHKTLLIDLDPQCNLSVYCMTSENLHNIWSAEDSFVDDYRAAIEKDGNTIGGSIFEKPRSIHFLLKPVEDGAGEIPTLPPPYSAADNLDLIPGRLSLHKYEYKISERWSSIYQGDPHGISTVTQIRTLCKKYSEKHNYEFIIIDTSPNLGPLNKVIISTVDGFLIPCLPDMFSLYGIRNIGNAIGQWKREFTTIYNLISDEKRGYFPEKFVRLLGYTVYNAQKEMRGTAPWYLAKANQNYMEEFPNQIVRFIPEEVRSHLTEDTLRNPVGMQNLIHSHNTRPAMAQKYQKPVWEVPNSDRLDLDDRSTIRGNRKHYEALKRNYIAFSNDLLKRIELLD